MAEMGKLRDVTVGELRPGMKVHQEITGVKGNILVSAGEVLTKKHVDQLNKWEKQGKPQGKAIPHPKGAKKGTPIQHEEWQGGFRPSHFNPSIKVTNTLGEPLEAPKVERDPEKSPLFQNQPTKSFSSPDIGIESPLFRKRGLEKEIQMLSETINQLGGEADGSVLPETEEALTERRDELAKQKNDLIVKLKENGVKDAKPKRGRPSAK